MSFERVLSGAVKTIPTSGRPFQKNPEGGWGAQVYHVQHTIYIKMVTCGKTTQYPNTFHSYTSFIACGS